MDKRKENCDFDIVLKGKWRGQIPNMELIEILKIVQNAFNESVKSIAGKIAKEEYPELVFSFFGEGSTVPGWNYQDKTKPDPALFSFQSFGKTATKKLSQSVEAMQNPHLLSEDNKSIVDIILPLKQIISEQNGFESMKWEFRDGQKEIELNGEIFKSIEIRRQEMLETEKAQLEGIVEARPMEIIGVLREVNTYAGKEKCQIEAPFFKPQIKCTYPEELEALICEYLTPPRPNVVATGKMEFKPETGDYKSFHIEKIRKAQTLFEEKMTEEEITDWQKYKGTMKELHPEKKASEITEWMIDTIWG